MVNFFRQLIKHPGHLAAALLSLGVILGTLIFSQLQPDPDFPSREIETEPITIPGSSDLSIYPKNSLVAGPIAIKGRAKPGEKIGEVKVINTSDQAIPVRISYQGLDAPKPGPAVVRFSRTKIRASGNSRTSVAVFLKRDIAASINDIIGNIAVRGLAPQRTINLENDSSGRGLNIRPFLTILIPVAIKLPDSPGPNIEVSKTTLLPDRLGLVPVADVINRGGLALDFSGQFTLRGPGGERSMPVEANQFIPGARRTSISGQTAWRQLRPGNYRLGFALQSAGQSWQGSYPVKVGAAMSVDSDQQPAALTAAADLSELSSGNIKSQFSVQNQSNRNLGIEVRTTISSKALISIKQLKQEAKTPNEALKIIAERQKENAILFQESADLGVLPAGKSRRGTVLALGVPLQPGKRYFLRTELFANSKKIQTDSEYINLPTAPKIAKDNPSSGPLFFLLGLLVPVLLLALFTILFIRSDARANRAAGEKNQSD